MAQVTFTVPDNVASRLLSDFCQFNGYTGTDPNGNPETQVQFLKRLTIAYWLNAAAQIEGRAAAVQAQANATNDVLNNIQIT